MILAPLQNYFEKLGISEAAPLDETRDILLKYLDKLTFQDKLAISIHSVLLKIAVAEPKNTECMFTFTEFDFTNPDSYVCLSTGHVFDRKSYRKWFKINIKSLVLTMTQVVPVQ